MENLDDKIAQLLNKAEWSDDEKLYLLQVLEGSENEHVRHLLKQQFEAQKGGSGNLDEATSKNMLLQIHEKIGVVKRLNKASAIKMWTVRIAVAGVVGLLVAGPYTWLKKHNTTDVVKSTPTNNKINQQVIEPGKNKAILTLADGSTIALDDQQNGEVAKQGNTKVLKLNGKLAYNSSNSDGHEILYNTIQTPAGGQYQIELPDGTLVWLNAASSLHFPTAFTGNERRVEVTGEAYFEVARNVKMPFKVKVNEAEVQVLGTGFNIMAYNDESVVKTTLVHGEVKFVVGGLSKLLKPGQQTQLTKSGQLQLVSGVDVDEEVAWKNGMFDFEGADIATVARRLSRWYNIEMVFDKKIEDKFYAKIPTNTNLHDVLKALELTGKVRFVVDGRKISVKAHN